jgi:hypothetical protein
MARLPNVGRASATNVEFDRRGRTVSDSAFLVGQHGACGVE